MACCRPFHIKNKNTYGGLLPSYYQVPCGYCLNCRVDRRDELQYYCEDLETRYKVGTFLTLTYDDLHIIENQFNDDLGVFSLTKKHLQNFFKLLRRKINYYNLDSTMCRKDFKYLAVGEYGHDSFRNHFHCLIFGLDYLNCEKLFRDCWGLGEIMSLPIKKGAFRYVLKYLDKQVKGSLACQLFDDYGLERPFSCHSQHFGTGFIEDNLDFILQNDGYFQGHNGKLVPISNYYRKKMSLSNPIVYDDVIRKMRSDNYIGSSKSKFYSLKDINDYRHRQALLREQALIRRSRDDGIPVDDRYLLLSNDNKLIQSIVDYSLYGDFVPF